MSTPLTTDLLGLVLAGGRSERMGQDKGSLEWSGQLLVNHCRLLLEPFCGEVLVSTRADQSPLAAYKGLRRVIDHTSFKGPAAGLAAAWAAHADAALLVLAVDLPLVDSRMLDSLIRQRDPAQIATVYRHPNGILEPLCAIWEPRAADRLREAAGASGAPSLRRILEDGPIASLTPSEPARLASCNTPDAYAAAQESFLTL